MQKINEKQKDRGVFLQNFVKTLVYNSITEAERNRIIEAENKQVAIEPQEHFRLTIKPFQKRMPFQQNQDALPRPQQGPPLALTGQESQKIKLGKITQFLLDPSIISVECPGPAKNILVNRSGKIQVAPTTLTKEEIDILIEEVSEKTRIPAIQGLFKVAFKDLLVTAIISDFIGTRFIIQKRTPFKMY